MWAYVVINRPSGVHMCVRECVRRTLFIQIAKAQKPLEAQVGRLAGTLWGPRAFIKFEDYSLSNRASTGNLHMPRPFFTNANARKTLQSHILYLAGTIVGVRLSEYAKVFSYRNPGGSLWLICMYSISELSALFRGPNISPAL